MTERSVRSLPASCIDRDVLLLIFTRNQNKLVVVVVLRLEIDRGPSLGCGPSRGCHILPRSGSGRGGGHKNRPGPGLNFKFIYRMFPRIRRLLKCKNPPLEIGVVSYNEYKSHACLFVYVFGVIFHDNVS